MLWVYLLPQEEKLGLPSPVPLDIREEHPEHNTGKLNEFIAFERITGSGTWLKFKKTVAGCERQ